MALPLKTWAQHELIIIFFFFFSEMVFLAMKIMVKVDTCVHGSCNNNISTSCCKSRCISGDNGFSELFFRTCIDWKIRAAKVTHLEVQEVAGAEGRWCWCWCCCPCSAVSLHSRPVCSVTAGSGDYMRTLSCLLPLCTTRLKWKRFVTTPMWPTKRPAGNERE